MRLVVTGAAGLVGNAVVDAAVRRGWEVLALYRECEPLSRKGVMIQQVDLAEPTNFQAPVLEYFPDAIVNATGITEVGNCEANPELAEKLNVALPRQMAMITHHIGARFVHLSTEQVFDGEGAPYHHTAMPMPRNLYGRLKLMSERDVLKAAAPESVVLRLPLLNGNSLTGNRSIHERLLQALARGEKPRLFTDVIRQPASAANVADVVIELLERPSLNGLFHWAGTEPLSRYEIGLRILRHFNLPEYLIEPAQCHLQGMPKDLRMSIHTLITRLKTRALGFNEQLEGLQLPLGCITWYNQQHCVVNAPMPRFIKGRDF